MAIQEEEKNDSVFQIKLSLINLSGFAFADLGIDGLLEMEKSQEWNDLLRCTGSDLLFLSQSFSVKFMVKLITKCHQDISGIF